MTVVRTILATVFNFIQTCMMTKALLLVGIGGATGSILRYLVSHLSSKIFNYQFPVGTFLVNISGSLLIGILIGLAEKHFTTQTDFKLLFITGFCGGFTTFSAFTAENLQLIQKGQTPVAILYIASSIILGILSVYTGIYLSK